MARLGADPGALRSLSTTFATSADDLVRVAGELARSANAASWDGPDAVAFRGLLGSQHGPALRSIAATMRDLGRSVKVQADEQERASAVDGAGTEDMPLHAGRPELHQLGPEYDVDGNGTVEEWEIDQVQTSRRDYPDDGEFAQIEHLHQGEDSPWIVQGLGYDDQIRRFLTAYYDEGSGDHPGVRLSVQDRDTGAETNDVYLTGLDGEHVLTKGGGVAVDGDFVYVADTDEVYVYRRGDIYGAEDGEEVEAIRVNEVEAGSASYVNIHDGQAYVGRWVENHPWKPAGDGDPEVNVYDIDPTTGRFVNDDGGHFYNVDEPRLTHAEPRATIETPYNVQGLDVDDEGIVFSASFSDLGPAPGDLIWQEWEDQGAYELSGDRHELDINDYGESVQIIDDDYAFVSFEEGARAYDGEGGRNSVHRYDLDDVKGD